METMKIFENQDQKQQKDKSENSEQNKENIQINELENLKQNQKIDTEINNLAKQYEENLIFSQETQQKSIQDCFKDFRKKKLEKQKFYKQIKSYHIEDRKSFQFQDELRQKFIDSAKKYIGIPYAKRHLQPENPLYNSELFLDCCALIRRAIWDLKEDFGFILSRWNQNYQYDTLPIDVQFEEMKPGDLIFYSCEGYGHFQCHDMVHVEIFIGGESGVATVGSRWTNTGVQIYDSYMFQSKKYKSFKYHYKSIQTWLEGICKSWCSKHKWLDECAILETEIIAGSKKFSIFNEAAESEPAEPDEEDNNQEVQQQQGELQKRQNNSEFKGESEYKTSLS